MARALATRGSRGGKISNRRSRCSRAWFRSSPEVRRTVSSSRSNPSSIRPDGHLDVGHPALRVRDRRGGLPRPAGPSPGRRSSRAGSGPPARAPSWPPGGRGRTRAPSRRPPPRRPGRRAPSPACASPNPGSPKASPGPGHGPSRVRDRRRPGGPGRPPGPWPGGPAAAVRRPRPRVLRLVPVSGPAPGGQAELLGDLHDLADPLPDLWPRAARRGSRPPPGPAITATTIGMLCTWSAALSCGLASTSTLASTHAPSASAGQLLQHRAELLARPAPLGPQIQDHRHGARPVDHVGVEGLVGDVDHMAGSPRPPGPPSPTAWAACCLRCAAACRAPRSTAPWREKSPRLLHVSILPYPQTAPAPWCRPGLLRLRRQNAGASK